MRFPFFNRQQQEPTEDRAEDRASVTDNTIAALLGNATNAIPAAAALAAVVAAGELLSSPFLSARVVGASGPATTAVFAALARDLAYSGNGLRYIDVNPQTGFIDLIQPSEWEVVGRGTSPASWVYRLKLAIPGQRQPVTRTVPARGLIHVRMDSDENEPWRGVPPWKRAALTAGVAAYLERGLMHKSSEPVAAIVATPDGATAPQRQAVARSISIARGAVVIEQTTAAGFGQGSLAAPNRKDFDVARTGPDHTQGNHALRQQVAMDVLGCYGIPGAYLSAQLQGTTWDSIKRHCFFQSQGWGNVIAQELSAKLGQAVDVDWADVLPNAVGVNLSQRIRSWSQLVKEGVSPASAAAIVGIPVPAMAPAPAPAAPTPAQQQQASKANGHVEYATL